MSIAPGIEAFAAALPRQGRLLGLDMGEKTIGLALSDLGRRVASPLETLKRGKFAADLPRLRSQCARHDIVGLVVGDPVNMDGSTGPRAQAARAFARNLDAPLGLPILMWDERLSTAAVTRTLLDADASRARRAQLVDKMAASYILQGALDRLARLQNDI
ncbi:MAG: Holliday junction resolvase RuvX [Pseudomonadota bacterium]